MIPQKIWILLSFIIYCWISLIASNIVNVSYDISVDKCKQLLICCGDSAAYANLGEYEFDEFDIGAQFYYQLLVACKFPNTSKMSCALAENKLANYMYHSANAFRAMDSICKQTSLALLQEGINRKEWVSAYFAYQFYAISEADSAKAIDNLRVSYSPDFRQIKDSNFIAYKIEEGKIKWQQQYKNIIPVKPSTPYIAIFETDSLRHAIRCDGDTIAYKKLIELSRLPENPYTFNECLYDAILMLCFYNYAPAQKHVYEILKSFYTENETPSLLHLRLLDIYKE